MVASTSTAAAESEPAAVIDSIAVAGVAALAELEESEIAAVVDLPQA